jgi:hypothetical protein
MAKFKVLKYSAGAGLKDASVGQIIAGARIGGVGGPPGNGVPTISVSFRYAGATYTGWILHRKGKKQYVVTDGTRTARCTLVNLNAAGLNVDGTMSILVTNFGGGTFNAMGLDNKRVLDWNGVKWPYHLAAATSAYSQVAFA